MARWNMPASMVAKFLLPLVIVLSYWNWPLLGWLACVLDTFPINRLSFSFLRVFLCVCFFTFSFHRGLLEQFVLWDVCNVSLLISHLFLEIFEHLELFSVPFSHPQSGLAFALCFIAHFWRLSFYPGYSLMFSNVPFIFVKRFRNTTHKIYVHLCHFFRRFRVDFTDLDDRILRVFGDPHLTFKLLTEHGLTSLDFCHLDVASKLFHHPGSFGTQGFLSLTELCAFELCRKHFDNIPGSDMRVLLQKCIFSYKLMARYVELVRASIQLRGRMASAPTFNLMLDKKGQLFLSGKDYLHLISENSAMNYSIPRRVQSVEHIRIKKLAAGVGHVIFVTESGQVYTKNLFSGHLMLLPGLESVEITEAAAGYDLSLLISSKGEVYSFGGFANPVFLGNGGLPLERITVPQKLDSLAGLFALQACVGRWHNMLLMRSPDGKNAVYTFGISHEGSLGLGDGYQEARTPRPISFFGDKHVVTISAGYAHSAAVDAEGCLYTWGRGWEGQLGHGYLQSETVPMKVTTPGLRNELVVNVTCGSDSTVVFCLDKVVALGGPWGMSGQELKSEPHSNLIHACSKNTSYASVLHYLAISESNEFFTWGKSDEAQLGLTLETVWNKYFFGSKLVRQPSRVWI